MAAFAVAFLLLAASALNGASAAKCPVTMGGATSIQNAAPVMIQKCACGATKYAAVGSSTGIGYFISGEYCIGVADDPLSNTQNAAAGGTNKWTIPLLISVYGFFAGGTTTAVIKMNALQLYDVYFSKGAKWPVGTKGLSGVIKPVARGDGSGTTFIVKKFWKAATKITVLPFSEQPFSASSNANPAIIYKSGGGGLCTAVSAIFGSLGYSQTGLCVHTTGLKTTEVSVKNAAGTYIQASSSQAVVQQAIPRVSLARDANFATFSTVFLAGQYTPPIVSYEFSFSKKSYPSGGGSVVKALLLYINKNGGTLAAPFGFAKLPASVQSGNTVAINKIT